MANGESGAKGACCGNQVWIPCAGVFMVLFVLMRMTIGWHFLFEGISKIYSTYSPKPFSSAGYFRESPGPMKKWMAGILPPDQDNELLRSLDPVVIQESLRKTGEDFATRLQLNEQEKVSVLDAVEKQLKAALFWRDGGNPGIRLGFERSINAWERAGTEELKKNALENREKVLGVLREFQERQKDLAKQIGAIAGNQPEINFPAVAQGKLDRAPLDLTDASQVASARSAILAAANKSLLSGAMGKNDPVALEQWKKWDKVVAMADKWADATQDWLTAGEETVEEPSPDGKGNGTLKKVMATPERVERFRELVAKKEEVGSSDRNWLFRKDVDKGALASAKAGTASARAGLKSELDKFQTDLVTGLEKQFEKKNATAMVQTVRQIKPIEIMDFMTIWGITAIGAGLFSGTLTRAAALGGVAFLAMTYLAVPAFPWLPAPPQNEGNYVFVNKNVVEMMALLVIAATPSGRWFGGDAFLNWLFCRKVSQES